MFCYLPSEQIGQPGFHTGRQVTSFAHDSTLCDSLGLTRSQRSATAWTFCGMNFSRPLSGRLLYRSLGSKRLDTLAFEFEL